MTGSRLSFERKYQIWGWALFIVSSLFYGAASIRAGDLLGVLGSLFFLVACIVFLVPFLFPGRPG
ncbi:hypothetical protein [Desulfobacula sp.]|uniref:hypothetical protein n=1 Tax=Desulfobacula sp. TaxID=2593537 RepID=UPI0025BA331B|nr:hypothetical protein [Desulfobacula sp.]MBC2703634.1 cytochrome oxidase subunit III [Desulfobacula sp.]